MFTFKAWCARGNESELGIDAGWLRSNAQKLGQFEQLAFEQT
jgi:hypothetical protein